MESAGHIDRRDQSEYFFGTTNPYWHESIRKIFERIDESGISYCLLHGYAGYDGVESGDIDCIVEAENLPLRFGQTLAQAAAVESYHLINSYHRSQQAYLFVLAKETDSGFDFIWLDVAFANFEGHWKYIDGPEMLAAKRPVNGFWATSPAIEFAAYVSTKITKQKLDSAHGTRLAGLYKLAPRDCERELRRFFTEKSVELIASAAKRDEWGPVRDTIISLKREVLSHGRKRALRDPSSALGYFLGESLRGAQRMTRQTGLHLLIRGPAGIAPAIAAESARLLAPAFRRVEVREENGRPASLLQQARSSLRTRWLLSKTNLLVSIESDDSQDETVRGPVDLVFDLDETGVIKPSSEAPTFDSTVRHISTSAVELMEQRTKRDLGLTS